VRWARKSNSGLLPCSRTLEAGADELRNALATMHGLVAALEADGSPR
jgi:hypothetical protein